MYKFCEGGDFNRARKLAQWVEEHISKDYAKDLNDAIHKDEAQFNAAKEKQSKPVRQRDDDDDEDAHPSKIARSEDYGFDVNVTTALRPEDTLSDAIIELVANAIDEHALKDTIDFHPYVGMTSSDECIIANCGGSITDGSFTLGASGSTNLKKESKKTVIGRHCIGLKVALAILMRENVEIYISSNELKFQENDNAYYAKKQNKMGNPKSPETLHMCPTRTTLNLDWPPYVDARKNNLPWTVIQLRAKQGTILYSETIARLKEALNLAKESFLIFSKEFTDTPPIFEHKNNSILSACEEGATDIFVNGLRFKLNENDNKRLRCVYNISVVSGTTRTKLLPEHRKGDGLNPAENGIKNNIESLWRHFPNPRNLTSHPIATEDDLQQHYPYTDLLLRHFAPQHESTIQELMWSTTRKRIALIQTLLLAPLKRNSEVIVELYEKSRKDLQELEAACGSGTAEYSDDNASVTESNESAAEDEDVDILPQQLAAAHEAHKNATVPTDSQRELAKEPLRPGSRYVVTLKPKETRDVAEMAQKELRKNTVTPSDEHLAAARLVSAESLASRPIPRDNCVPPLSTRALNSIADETYNALVKLYNCDERIRQAISRFSVPQGSEDSTVTLHDGVVRVPHSRLEAALAQSPLGRRNLFLDLSQCVVHQVTTNEIQRRQLLEQMVATLLDDLANAST